MRKIALHALEFNLTPLGRWAAGQHHTCPRIVRRLASAYGLTTSTAGTVAALAGFPVEGLHHD